MMVEIGPKSRTEKKINKSHFKAISSHDHCNWSILSLSEVSNGFLASWTQDFREPHTRREWQIASRDPSSLIGHGHQSSIGSWKSWRKLVT